MEGIKQVIPPVIIVIVLLQGCSLVLTPPEHKTIELPQEVIEEPQQTEQEPEELLEEQEEIIEEPVINPLGTGPFANQTALPATLMLLDNTTTTKNDIIQEKHLILYFFTTYCIDCEEELDEMRKTHLQYKKHIDIVAISIDSIETIEELTNFKKKHHHIIEFSTYNQELSETFQVTSPGTKIAINKKNIIIARDSFEYQQNDWQDLFEELISDDVFS